LAEEKKKLSAKEVVADIRAGAADEFLMKKYGISDKGLQSLFQKLIAAKVLIQADLDRRASVVEEVEAVIIAEDEVKPVPTTSTSTQAVFRCPACNMPQGKEFDVCPQCGIIVEKFLKKIQEQKALEDQMSREQVEGKTQNTTTNEEALHEPAGNIQNGHDPAMAGNLDKLGEALRAGVLNQSEYEAKKAECLGVTEKLAKLKEAFDAGIFSRTEFETKRRELIGEKVAPGVHLANQTNAASFAHTTDIPRPDKGLGLAGRTLDTISRVFAKKDNTNKTAQTENNVADESNGGDFPQSKIRQFAAKHDLHQHFTRAIVGLVVTVLIGSLGWFYTMMKPPEPGEANRQLELGLKLKKSGNDKGAIKHFQKAIKYEPKFSEAYFELSAAYSRQGDDKKSIEYLQKSLEISPNADRHFILGILLRKHGRNDEAIKHFGEGFRVAIQEDGMISDYLDRGVDPNTRLEIKLSDGRKTNPTPLIYASFKDRFIIVSELLKKGADIEAKDNAGNTALIWAARGGATSSVRRLLDKGANTSARNNLGNTPLAEASRVGKTEVVGLLREYGARE
jgi:tetratricopeptide (TPR) repeat protein